MMWSSVARAAGLMAGVLVQPRGGTPSDAV